VIGLKHKPDGVFVQFGAAFFRKSMDGFVQKIILPSVCFILDAYYFQLSGFARPRRPHNGQKLSFFYIETYIAQHPGFLHTCAIKSLYIF
jgi:hypothetical protein